MARARLYRKIHREEGTDNGILMTFFFRLQIKFKGTYQLTVDFRQWQITLSVFLSDKFGKIGNNRAESGCGG